jgi:cysteine desulfurase
VGGLLLAPAVKLDPLWQGGQQQLGLRPGTEPVALAVGMATALRIATKLLPQMSTQVGSLRNHFEELLQNNIPSCLIHSKEADRIPTTTSVSFPGVDRQALLLRLDIDGIACSTGSACTSGSSEPSHVLAAMGVPATLIESAVRFGLSKLSTLSDIEQSVDRISIAINKLRFH